MGALILHFILLRMVLSLSLFSLIKSIIGMTILVIVITQINGFVIKNYITTEWQLVFVGVLLNAASLAAALYCVERKKMIPELIDIYKGCKV